MPRATADERNSALLAWYRSTRRDLPWRGAADPYAVLVSECMLQQTQAARVIPFYERFIERFPTVESLADAPLADVLDVWSGLGYNTRAQRLREAATVIARDGWPHDPEALGRLPGVGPYTAAAIACFGFGRPEPTIDTNVRRVLSRWHGEILDGKALEQAAREDLDHGAAADWNQAVMDLGATICRPRAPRCDLCPVEAWCSGPDAYRPPRPQSRFEGSVRQVRGAIVRSLIRAPREFSALVADTGYERDLVGDALVGLMDDGLVTAEPDGHYRVAD